MMRSFLQDKNKIAATLVAFALLLPACASFKGPGPLVLGSGSSSAQSASDSTRDATRDSAVTAPSTEESAGLRLSGPRGFSQNTAGPQFDWPVDQARMSRGFFASASKRKRSHWGIDLANQRGSPILAAEKGTVIYTGRAFHGYGKLVVIEHGEEWATLYGHLDKILVKEGQIVEKGENIGRMGRTGRATGVHLHFEVRHFRQPVNPLAYLPSVAGSKVSGQPDVNAYQLLSQDSH